MTIESFAATERTNLPASNVCFGTMTTTPDRRLLFLPTDLGLALFDTHTRALVEVLPDVASCSDRIVADPSGRWWFVLTPATPSRVRRHRIVDAVARRVIADTSDSTLLDVAFDDLGVQYELHQLANGPAPYVLRRIARSPNGEPAWESPLGQIESARHVVATRAHVFVSAVLGAQEQQHQLHRYDAISGAAAGGYSFLDLSTPVAQELKVASMAAAGDRVYVSGWYGIYHRLGVLVFDATTLTAIEFATETFPDGWSAGAIAVTPGAADIYRTRNRVQLVQAPGGTGGRLFYSVAIDRLSPEPPSRILKTTATWTPFVAMLTSASSAVGQIAPPGTPHVTALATKGRRVQLSWLPDAAGAPHRQFIIRGAVRGERISTVLATVDADTRTWQSPIVPPGEYVLELVAANTVGESVPARLDVGIATSDAALGATNLQAFSAGRSIAELTWTPPGFGPLPNAYLVEAATPGGTFVPIAQTILPRLVASSIPAGTWQVRVRSVAAGVPGASSNTITVDSATCVATNDPPRTLAALTNGSRVTLQWAHPASGPAVNYRINVATDAAGLTAIASVLVDGSQTSIEVDAPAGTFVISVRAESPCANSEASNTVVVRVP